MGRWLGVGIGLLLLPISARLAEADFMCRVLAVCTYEGRPFRLKVVDAETGQPLADVHALAGWVLYGFHGTDGPLMVQDAVSGPDGMLAFPAWGPITGPKTGLVHGSDPEVSLFKVGYRTRRIQNHYPPGTEETTRVREFGQDGHTIALEPFRGTPEGWIEELKKAAWEGSLAGSDEQLLQFRGPLLSRTRRIWAERKSLPERYQRPGEFFWHEERTIKSLEGGR